MDITSPMIALILILVPILSNTPEVLIPISLYFLPHIIHLIIDPSDGLVPGVALSISCLSHHTLGLINLTYKRFVPVPGVTPLHIGRPCPLTEISASSQQAIYPPLHIYGCLLPLPLDLLGLHPGVQYGGSLLHHPCCTEPSSFPITWYPDLIATPEVPVFSPTYRRTYPYP